MRDAGISNAIPWDSTIGSIVLANIIGPMISLTVTVVPVVETCPRLVCLDIIGDKLLEINVFSPGGLGQAQRHEGANFTHAVINALERKVNYMSFYLRKFDNKEMATL